ncbi:type II secretion system F family protein [Pseudomonas borbori]
MSPSQPLLLSLAERAQLFAHLAAMEQAGVPAQRALASLSLPTRAQAALQRMRAQLEKGRDIASAGQLSGLLGPLDSNLLRAAQASGCLAAIYRRLAERYAHKASQAARLRSRLLMPAMVFLLALFIQPLPALVGGQLSGAAYLWVCLRPLMLIGVLYALGRQLLLRRQHKTTARAGLLDALLNRIPVLGAAYARSNVRNFFDSLGLMLEAGLPMLEALPNACATMTDAALRTRFARVQASIRGGQSLTEALGAIDFPGKAMALGVVRTGEASGTLPASLLSFAASESRQLDSLREQLAVWLPRMLYAGLCLWMAAGLLGGDGFTPRLPADLR